jgi:predicted acyl esterase
MPGSLTPPARAAATLGLAALLVVGWGAAGARAEQRLCTETLIKMSDGVRLHAWVSRLAPDQARPVLFMMDSYARGGVPGAARPSYNNACPQSLPDDYVPSYLSTDLIDRFTLVQVSYRGTGSSEGMFDMTGPRTQRDIHEAIAWAARQPFSDGHIVLTGESGTGFYAFHALRDAHVAAAVIYTSCADMYRCFYRGGQYNGLADVYLAGTGAGYLAGVGARDNLGTNVNPAPPLQLAALGRAAALALADGVDDGYWKQRSALAELPKVSIPVMYTSDLYDIVGPYDALQLTPGARLVLGMGHLSGDMVAAGGANYTALLRTPVDRFVAHYGLGVENSAERDPRVTLVTNTGGVAQFRAGRTLIRSEDSWPLAGTVWTRLYLGGGRSGSASSLNDGTLGATPPVAPSLADPAPLVSAVAHPDLRTSEYALGSSQPTDLRNEERTALTYTTPALKRPLEVSGPISLRLFAAATAPDFDWSVRLADVWPDGRSEWITDGYLRASLRKVDERLSLRTPDGKIARPWLTYDSPELVPPAQTVEYQLDIIGSSNVFAAGHRLRLDLLPVAAAQLDSARSAGGGAVTVARDGAHPSSLMLPVIPDRCGRSTPLTAGTPHPDRCASGYVSAVSSSTGA